MGNGQLQDLQTNCNQCVLKKEELCPYLETIMDCYLFNDLKSREIFGSFKNEKRQYPRKALSVPAVINQQESGQTGIGAITEISLGGVRLLIPKDFKHRILIDSRRSRFEIVFSLPAENKPIRLSCESNRVVDGEDGVQVGACFVGTDSRSYKAFKNYLM